MNVSRTTSEVQQEQSSGHAAAAWSMRDLIQDSLFWRPIYLGKTAWAEHLPFAFWLVETTRPQTIVELGSHYGTSYFAFCQAVDRLGLASNCYAIDTWKGDEHAGFYGGEVYEQVKAHNDRLYSSFSRLVRSTFDEALLHFSDSSIDLLHIDGLHTEEAVTHDFQSWLPKMSERGVIIMHDTNVRERGFGVFKLFESIRKKYPHFEFVHGHGLGVVAVGTDSAPMLRRLLDSQASEFERREIQDIFGTLGRACADALALINQGDQLKNVSTELSASRKQLEEARKALESARADVQTRAKELADARAQIRKQTDEAAAERGRLEERVRLFEESRNDLRREVEHLREAGVAKAAEMAGQADAVALQEQNATLQRHLEERFHEVCVLTHVIEDLERALQDKNNVAAAEAKARNEIAALKAENQQLIDRLGGCQVENQQLADRLGGSVVESRELSERLEDCQGERDAQLARVQDLLSSRSWRVTSPLRVSMNLFRAMFRS